MKNKSILLHVVITFFLALVTSSVVTLLWNLLIEKKGALIDWKTSFMLAVIIGIVIPVSQRKRRIER